jgi:hypothetical protein
MEIAAIVTVIVGVLVGFVALWATANGTIKKIAEANVKLNQKVNKQDEILRRKNKQIAKLFLAGVETAPAQQLVDILNGLLEDSRSKGTDPVSARPSTEVHRTP